MNSLFVGFLDFIHSQDPNRQINNMNWKASAVGDYCRHIDLFITPVDLSVRLFESDNSAEPIFAPEFKQLLEDGAFETYGQLQDYVRRF